MSCVSMEGASSERGGFVEGREVHEAKNGVGAKTIAARKRGRGLQSVNFGSETSAERGQGAVVAGSSGRRGEAI